MASQAELIALVEGLIIDNNTNQITPAKVREVLKEIIASIPPGGAVSSLTAKPPLRLEEFSGILYSDPNPVDNIRQIQKGFVSGVENGSYDIELNDICLGLNPATGEWGFWQYIHIADDQDFSNYIPVATVIVNV